MQTKNSCKQCAMLKKEIEQYKVFIELMRKTPELSKYVEGDSNNKQKKNRRK